MKEHNAPVFEKTVHLESIANMSHRLKNQPANLVHSHNRDLLPG
jgi:hypothetical protein